MDHMPSLISSRLLWVEEKNLICFHRTLSQQDSFEAAVSRPSLHSPKNKKCFKYAYLKTILNLTINNWKFAFCSLYYCRQILACGLFLQLTQVTWYQKYLLSYLWSSGSVACSLVVWLLLSHFQVISRSPFMKFGLLPVLFAILFICVCNVLWNLGNALFNVLWCSQYEL